jgi:cell wall assembly regulator SMI1
MRESKAHGGIGAGCRSQREPTAIVFFVDLNPTEEGRIGQVVHFSHEEGPQKVVANSMADWVLIIAESIEVDE